MSEVAEPLYCGLMNTSMSLDDSSNFADSCGELNLSNQGLKKVTKDLIKSSDIASLVLDHNSLQRIENVDHLTQLICLSAVSNKLVRMYGVARLRSLTRLNLSQNGIVTVEGLRNLCNLHWLSLSGNKIKQLEGLSSNLSLEYVDLSDNLIQGVSDISLLKNLQVLKLDNNRLTTLKFCSNLLPSSVKVLMLANNLLNDLNEVSYLSAMSCLETIAVAHNPCVSMTGMSIGFDHRPFIINWCMSLRTIDGYTVGAKESLQAEWLYSQGKGRQFHIGEHSALVDYLSSVCPLSDEKLSSQDEQKLMLILSKAQQHQRQLWEETSASVTPARVSSPPRKPNSSSPSLSHSRLSASSPRNQSPVGRERKYSVGMSSFLMTSSTYNVALPVTLYAPDSNNLMTASADATMLSEGNQCDLMSRSLDPNLFKEKNCDPPRAIQLSEQLSPLKAASKLVPVPETIMSPDYRPATNLHGSPLQQRPKVNGSHFNELMSSSSTKSVFAAINSSNHTPPVVRTSRSILSCRSKSSDGSAAAAKQNRRSYPIAKHAEPSRPSTAPSRHKLKAKPPRNESSDEDSEMSVSKLETIQNLAQARKHDIKSKLGDVCNEKHVEAVVKIQKVWRGYHVRNLSPKIAVLKRDVQSKRQEDHIKKLSDELTSAKAALQVERKLRLLQMEAIKALWREVQGLQSPKTPQTPLPGSFSVRPSEVSAVSHLTETCAQLQEQVQQLQLSLESVVRCMTTFGGVQLPAVSWPDIEAQKQINQAQTNVPPLMPTLVSTSMPVQVTKEPTPEPVEQELLPVIDSNLLDIRHAKSKQRPSYLPIFNLHSCSETRPLAEEPVKQFAGSFVESLINTAMQKVKARNVQLVAPDA